MLSSSPSSGVPPTALPPKPSLSPQTNLPLSSPGWSLKLEPPRSPQQQRKPWQCHQAGPPRQGPPGTGRPRPVPATSTCPRTLLGRGSQPARTLWLWLTSSSKQPSGWLWTREIPGHCWRITSRLGKAPQESCASLGRSTQGARWLWKWWIWGSSSDGSSSSMRWECWRQGYSTVHIGTISVAEGRRKQDYLPFSSIMLVPRTTIAGGMEAMHCSCRALCVLGWKRWSVVRDFVVVTCPLWFYRWW